MWMLSYSMLFPAHSTMQTPLLFLCAVIAQTVPRHAIGNSFPWPPMPPPWQPLPDWMPPRNDLLCTTECDKCQDKVNDCEYDDCCMCKCMSSWEDTEEGFTIEFITLLGKSVAIPISDFNQSAVYEIVHPNSDMTELPSNLCNWDDANDPIVQHLQGSSLGDIRQFSDNIVYIKVSYNQIKSLPNITCLTRLDRLILDHNAIEYVSNTSLSGLRYLRHVDLSHNRIHSMSPSVITAAGLNLLKFDMSFNDLDSLDVTNMMGTNAFCKYSYASNGLSSLTNLLNITLDKDRSYGPGIVSVAENHFETFPDFKLLLNLDSLAELGQLIKCGFDVRGPALNCDCHIQEFVDLSVDVLKGLYRDYMDVECESPDEVKGVKVVNVTQDMLVCNAVAKCPLGCSCVDMPSQNTMFVNCSGLSLLEMPRDIPESSTSGCVHLDVSQNAIRTLPDLPYLKRVCWLNASHNTIESIHGTAFQNLQNASFVDISNNPTLRFLPQSMRYRSTCSLNMSNLEIQCDCDNQWLADWPQEHCNGGINDTLFTCLLKDGRRIPALQFNIEELNCPTGNQSYVTLAGLLSVVLCLFIAVATLTYLFRYEIYILVRQKMNLDANKILPQLKYDVFVSLDEENDLLRKWVALELVRGLEELGYCVFLPYRDVMVGEVRDNAVIEVMPHCRNFLLVLSESYLIQDDMAWIENEWKYGWRMFRRNSSKNIVLVNFDHVSSSDVRHKQIKAFLRVGSTVDFLNINGDIMQMITKRLGPPNQVSNKGVHNKSGLFDTEKLSIVELA